MYQKCSEEKRVLYTKIFYQKHIFCSYSYKLVSVYDKFSKPFNTYLG